MKTGNTCPTVLYRLLRAYTIRPYVLFSSGFYFLFSLRDTIHEILDTNYDSLTTCNLFLILTTIHYSLTTISLSPNSYLLSREGFNVEFHPDRFSSLLIVYSEFPAMEVARNSYYAISEFKII